MKRFSLLEILIPLWSVRHSNPVPSHCAASQMQVGGGGGGVPFRAVPGPITYTRSCKKRCLANSFAIIKKTAKVVVVVPPHHHHPLLPPKIPFGAIWIFTRHQWACRNNRMCILKGADINIQITPHTSALFSGGISESKMTVGLLHSPECFSASVLCSCFL